MFLFSHSLPSEQCEGQTMLTGWSKRTTSPLWINLVYIYQGLGLGLGLEHATTAPKAEIMVRILVVPLILYGLYGYHAP